MQQQKPISTAHIMQFNAGSIIVNLRFYEEIQKYKITISKNDESYFPKETKLESNTREFIYQLLEIEFRGEELQYFIGFENRRKFNR